MNTYHIWYKDFHSRAFKVSRERIRQIEKKALKRLKHPTRKAALEDFLE